MYGIAFLFLLNYLIAASALQYGEILFVIMTQKHPYHVSLAERLKDDIINQAHHHDRGIPTVLTTTSHGAWTVLPQLKDLYKNYQYLHKWVVFCNDQTAVRLNKLHDVLGRYDHGKKIWLGHGLKDVEPTIIHHFALVQDDFLYPNIASGFAMSMGFVHTVNKILLEANDTRDFSEFSIDPAYELAQYFSKDRPGLPLTHVKEFCVVSSDMCATYPKTLDTCGEAVSRESLFFAIKTYHKFHSSRVHVVKKTWGKYIPFLMFFSDMNDSSLPSVDLGVPNVDRGHCGKTMAIIYHLSNMLQSFPLVKWVVIADDDTILSVSRICEILPCYGQKNIALGERYGFHIWRGKAGYDYLTGGAGFVFSVDLFSKLVNCACPSPGSPDDMWLGVCLARIHVPVIHSPLFHQGRPADYPLEYLAPHRPVSFHKHWMINPVDVYKQWFEEDDSKLIDADFEGNRLRHVEL